MTMNLTSIVGLAVLLAACGSDSPSPSAPTPTPTPTPTPVSELVSYAGPWSGTYTVTACEQTSDFNALFCDIMSIGNRPVELTVVQRQSDVTGSFLIGSDFGSDSGFTVGSHRGMVDGDGHLRITAQISSDYNISVTNWNTTLSGREMVGTFTQEWRYSDGRPGTGQVDCTLTTVMQDSTPPAAGASPQTLEQTGRATGVRRDGNGERSSLALRRPRG